MAKLLGALLRNESGGRNIANTHEGTSSGQAQGYFQITTGTWDEFGGRKYASTPLEATYEQQAEIASKIPLRRWDESTVAAMRNTGIPIDRNRTLGENLAAAGETFGTGPAGGGGRGGNTLELMNNKLSGSPYALPPKGSVEAGKRDTPSSGRPVGSDLGNSPYTLPTQDPYGGPGEGASHFGGVGLGTPGTADNPLVVKNQENPFAKAGAAIAKAGQADSRNTQIQNIPNPQANPMPTMPTIDPSSSNRNALIAALMKLNSGQLWPMGGGGQVG